MIKDMYNSGLDQRISSLITHKQTLKPYKEKKIPTSREWNEIELLDQDKMFRQPLMMTNSPSMVVLSTNKVKQEQ